MEEVKVEQPCYLYRHIRKDTNEVFYVGVGKVYEKDLNTSVYERYYSRAYHKHSRNRFWKFVVDKTDYEVEIIMDSNNYESIKLKEIEFVSLYGRRDLGTGTLVNLTGGGDGNLDVSAEERYKRSERMKGRFAGELNPMYGKCGELHHNFGKKASEETCLKLRKPNEKLKSGLNPSAKTVIHYLTNEEGVCAKDISDKYGYNHSSFCYMLRFKHFNDTGFMYKEDYEKGYKPNQFLTKKIFRPIIDIATKQIFKNTSYIKDIKPWTLLRYLKNEQPNPTNYRYLDEYENEQT